MLNKVKVTTNNNTVIAVYSDIYSSLWSLCAHKLQSDCKCQKWFHSDQKHIYQVNNVYIDNIEKPYCDDYKSFTSGNKHGAQCQSFIHE